jgi:hypothetical protein
MFDTADAAASPKATSPPTTSQEGQQHATELIGARAHSPS